MKTIRYILKTIRYILKAHRWPSKLQRDFMSSNPARQARVRAVADAVIAEMAAEDMSGPRLRSDYRWEQ